MVAKQEPNNEPSATGKEAKPTVGSGFLLWIRVLIAALRHHLYLRSFSAAAHGDDKSKAQGLEYRTLYRLRVINFGGESLKMIYSLMKAIGLTTATIVLMQLILKTKIVFDGSRPVDWYLIMVYAAWVISFMVLLITYEAPMYGSLLLFTMPPWWVTVLPAGFIVLEFMAFAIMAPQIFTEAVDKEHPWPWVDILGRWLLVNGIYHILISTFCSRAVAYTEGVLKGVAGSVMANALHRYLKFLDIERFGSRLMGIVSLIASFIYWRSDDRSVGSLFWMASIALLIAMLFGVAISLVKQYEKRTVVDQLCNLNDKAA